MTISLCTLMPSSTLKLSCLRQCSCGALRPLAGLRLCVRESFKVTSLQVAVGAAVPFIIKAVGGPRGRPLTDDGCEMLRRAMSRLGAATDSGCGHKGKLRTPAACRRSFRCRLLSGIKERGSVQRVGLGQRFSHRRPH